MGFAVAGAAVHEVSRLKIVGTTAVYDQSLQFLHVDCGILVFRQHQLLPLFREALVDLVRDDGAPSVVPMLHVALYRMAKLRKRPEKPMVNARVLRFESERLVVPAELQDNFAAGTHVSLQESYRIRCHQQIVAVQID